MKIDIRTKDTTLGTETSIFTSEYATLNAGANLEEHAEDYAAAHPVISEGTMLTLHIIDFAGAGDITVQLELESLNDENEASE